MPAPANSDNGRAAAQDFAGALRAAAGKVTRKTGQFRAPKPDTGGAALPENGNRSPPLTPPSPPMAAAPSAPVAISAPMPASPAVVQSPTMAASPAVVQSPTVAASPPVVASPPVTVPPPGTTSLPSAATVSGLIQAAAEASDVANAGAGRGAPDDALSGAAGAQTHGPSATDEIDGAGQEPGTASSAAARTVGEAVSTAAVRGAAAETAASTGAADASRIAAGISQAALAANRLPAARITDSAPHTTAPPVAPNESAAPSASTQSTEVAALELALAEGSDATGAAATAVQQAGSAAAPVATASALDAAQGPILQSIAGAADAPAAVPQVAASTLADAGDGGAHARGGAGDGGTGGSSGGNSGGNSSAAAQQLSANPSSAASTDTSPAATLRVGAAVDSADFPQGLADRVSFMVDSNLSSAKLQVNPPQLGPIELQIAVQGDHAQIWMSTHSAVTREALESSLPRLRDMLGAQGFGQVSVDISQRSFQERSASPAPYEWAPSAPRAAASASPQPVSAPRISSAAVDAYA